MGTVLSKFCVGRVSVGAVSINPERDSSHIFRSFSSSVAGTAAGKKFGVAEGANIVAVKVLGGEQGSGSTSSVIAGIDWVTKKHNQGGNNALSVANLSLGGIFSLSMNQAVENMAAAGVVVTVAAGNSQLPACLFSPASAQDILSVGATTIEDEKSSFSNFGVCVVSQSLLL